MGWIIKRCGPTFLFLLYSPPAHQDTLLPRTRYIKSRNNEADVRDVCVGEQIAKDFGKKFATGSSVTKTPSGGEEIVVQGDVSPEIEELLLEHYKDIPEDNIELVDDKKKKKAAG